LSIKAKKSLGQHFLADRNILANTARSLSADAGSIVIEIGPGTGALTQFLHNSYKNLTIIEIDTRAVEVLKDRFPGLKIVEDDILNIDWNDVIPKGEKSYVIGNLPYYLTSPILFKVLDSQQYFHEAVFMIQKEVGDRLVAIPRTKNYGILSVQVQRLSEVRQLFNVSRHAFRPKPEVESCVVRLRFNKPELRCSLHHFKTVVRTAFNQRRKKLSNALKPVTGDVLLPDAVKNKRAEELTPAEFEELTVYLENMSLF
jgi:16S rRNA (adenine1518-N6/adenine1519-N6)-dimethyltransferase